MITVQACRRSRLLTWHSVDDDGAVLGGLLLTPLPSYGGVAIYCVRCRALFVWLCSFRRVMYNCFYFLNDKAVLLLSFQIKKTSSRAVPKFSRIRCESQNEILYV